MNLKAEITMKENSDIMLTAYNNKRTGFTWAQLANHTVRSAVDIMKTYQYGYQLGLARSLGPEYATAEQIRELQEKRLKSTVMGIGGALLLLIAAIGELNKD